MEKLGIEKTPHGEVYYYTRDRVFVLRTTEDAHGPVPCWAYVGLKKDTVQAPRPQEETRDTYNDNVHPREGFVYPLSGTKVTCMTPFQVESGETIPVNTVGLVKENRYPGTVNEVRGYIGCVIAWPCLKKYGPDGTAVIPWDKASDPAIFAYA